MGVDTNILDYINVLNQTQIDKEDLPEFWYRVVDKFEKYKGCLLHIATNMGLERKTCTCHKKRCR